MRNKARRLSLTGYFLWVTTHQLCLSLTPLLLPSLCRQPWCSMASAQGSAANSHVDSCQWQLVILSSPFCHFRAPVLTFRKCCLCPSKLGAPDGGGHESLPLQDLSKLTIILETEKSRPPLAAVSHMRGRYSNQGMQLSFSNTCRLVFLFCSAFWDQVVLMGDRIRRGCEELEG